MNRTFMLPHWATLPPLCLTLLTLATGAVQAQEAVDLARIRPCADCRITLTPIARLGTDDGVGAIDSENAQVRFSDAGKMYGVFEFGGSHVKLFDSDGRFLRQVGTKGAGPGEISELIDVHFSGANLVMLEGNGKVMTVSPVGTVITEPHLFDVPLGRFRVISDSSIVVASSSARLTGQFGAINPGSTVLRSRQPVLLGWSPNTSTIWWGNTTPAHLEEWSLDGVLRRVIGGSLTWASPPRLSDGFPGTLVSSFAVDHDDRLLVITMMPDTRWGEAPRHGAEGYVLAKDMNLLFDSRLDVFDLRRQRHHGTITWDEASVSLTQVGRNVVVTRVEYDAALATRLVLYTVATSTP